MKEIKPNWNWRDDDDSVHRLYDGDEPITLGDPCFDTPEQEELLCRAVNSHDDMLAALKSAQRGLEHAIRVCDARDMDGTAQAIRNDLITVNAAITKAEGGAE